MFISTVYFEGSSTKYALTKLDEIDHLHLCTDRATSCEGTIQLFNDRMQ